MSPVRRLALIAWMLATAHPVSAQIIRGRVVESQSRQGVADAMVSLLNADSTEISNTTTDGGGFFQFTVSEHGVFFVTVETIGFQTESRRVEFRDGPDLSLAAFVLARHVIPLDTIRAEGERAIEGPPVGFGRASHVLSGEQMAVLERHGVSIYTAIRELGGSLRQRRIRRGGKDLQCIESRRRITNMGGTNGCEMVTLVLDGVVIGNPLEFIYDLQVRDYESIEYVAPVEAGNRYGRDASAFGALVLWTRGHGPHVSKTRNGGG